MVVLVLFFHINVGLASFGVAAILSFLNVSDETAALRRIPWGTLLLICGVGVLMNVIILTGGIDLLSDALASIMSDSTAVSILGITQASFRGSPRPPVSSCPRSFRPCRISCHRWEAVLIRSNGSLRSPWSPIPQASALIDGRCAGAGGLFGRRRIERRRAGSALHADVLHLRGGRCVPVCSGLLRALPLAAVKK